MSGDTREKKAAEELRIILLDFASRRQSLIKGVQRVIINAIEQLKMSMILPKLLEDQRTLIKVLTGTQYEPAIKLIDSFIRRREVILKDKRPPLMDHGMIRIIDYFLNNLDMYKLLSPYASNMSKEDQIRLKAFETLLKISSFHLNREARVQINEERRLFKIYKESITLNKSIGKYEAKIASYQTTLRWRTAAKAAYLDKIQKDIDEKQMQVDRKIGYEVEKTQRAARYNKKLNLEKMNQLHQEIETAQSDWESQTKENRKYEKLNREEKNKYLIQLQSIIKKYDTVMADKMTEILELEDQLETSQKELSSYMKIYNKEHKIYYEVVEKREMREERDKKLKILKYQMNRAARIIQKYWRKWQIYKKKQNRKHGKKRKTKV